MNMKLVKMVFKKESQVTKNKMQVFTLKNCKMKDYLQG